MANLILFIGLGGTGMFTLLNLKKRLLEYHGEDEVGRSFAFQYFDTDMNEVDRMKNAFSLDVAKYGNAFFNQENEYLWLGGFVPRDVAAAYERLRSTPGSMEDMHRNLDTWLDDRASIYFSQQVLRKGADANRQLGRFCLMVKEPHVVSALTSKINALNTARIERGTHDQLQIYVISSSCGGTGSSMLYDTLFICNRVYKAIAKGEPQICAVVYAPFDYIQLVKQAGTSKELEQRYKMNAWAFFEEIEYAFWDFHYSGKPVLEKGTAIKSNCFNPVSADVKAYDGNWTPFASAFIVDSQLDSGRRIPQNLFIQNVANALFYTITSSGNARVASTLTNQGLPQQQPVFRTAPVYHTFGYRALEYPRHFFMKYFRTRFAYEALSFGLLRPLNIPMDKIRSDARQHCDETVYSILNEFKSKANEQLRDDDGQGLTRQLGIGRFCKPRQKPGDELEIDPKKVNDATLNAAIEEAKDLALKVKDSINALSLEHMGNKRSDTEGKKTGYERVAQRSQRVLRDSLGQYGVNYLAGEPLPDGGFKRGVFAEIDATLTSRYFEAYREYQEKEERLRQMLNDPDGSQGLEQLKQRVQESAPGLLGRVGELEKALKAFNRKRHEYIEEYFEREILGHELKFLFDTSAGDEAASASVQRTIEGFEITDKPLVDEFEDQVKRIKAEMTPLEGELQRAYIVDLPKEFRATETDLMTQYLPNLSGYLDVENQWVDNSNLDRLYRRLCERKNLEQFSAVMREMLDVDNNCKALGFRIEDLCADDQSSAEPQKKLLKERIQRFVDEKFFGDQEVRNFLDRALAEVFLSYPEKSRTELSQERIRNAFVSALATMTMEEASIIKEGELIVYCSADGPTPDPSSIVRKMGYDPDNPQKIQYVPDDQNNRHRIVALKIKPNFVKEELKNFAKELQAAYTARDRNRDLAHLSKEWNINGVLRTTEKQTLEQALMKGLAFYLLLHSPKYGLAKQKDGIINKLFTEETGGYDGLVQDSPIFFETVDEVRKLKRLVACPSFGNDWLDDEGRIRLKTREGSKSLLLPLADQGDRYETAIASLSKYPFIGENLRKFEAKFLKAFKEAVPDEAERKNLLAKVMNGFQAKITQFNDRVGRGDTSCQGDLNVLWRMQKELTGYMKEIFPKDGQETGEESEL